MASFDDLGTVSFQKKMKPAAIRIYEKIFPNCVINDLRENGVAVHVLDKEFGIDSLITFPSGQWISIQEKYRRNNFIRYLDFTQEYLNAAGTPNEAKGEWFKLGAQLYFYGWANKEENDFEKWALLDIAKYKMLVEKSGGLDKIGLYKKNMQHGRASFYAIPIKTLFPAFIADYRNFK
jgi:hypothetical protein